MSLLLDALKKAAEQKAGKAKSEGPDAVRSDEKIIDAVSENTNTSGLEPGSERDSQMGYPDSDDETEFDHSDYGTRLERARLQRPAPQETDLNRAEVPANTTGVGRIEMPSDPTDRGALGPDPEVEEDQSIDMQHEDMSLMLRENTTDMTGSPISVTGPQAGQTTPTDAAPDTVTYEGTTNRADSTLTRTYAPDNYDRTLMKLPGEDASKLFAGMKSDADVVMTPEYAKKVFQSKSSAKRRHYVAVYLVIVGIILGSLTVFGFNDMVVESDNIRVSLQPLKRDPMPGVIKPVQKEDQNLFGEDGIDAKTIELVESAENDSSASEGAIIEESAAKFDVAKVAEVQTAQEIEALLDGGEVDISSTIAKEAPTSESETTIDAVTNAEAAGSAETRVSASEIIADINAPNEADTLDDKPNLHIASSRQLENKHKLLREAYTAYQAGRDELALSKYDEVLEIEPSNRNALLARAAINVQNNNVGAAIEDYRQLLLDNPKDSLALTSLITVANVTPADAESQLKLMIRDEPDSPYLNFALANAYGAQNRWLEAQGHYFTALANNPTDPNYAYNLAVSLEHIAKPKLAVSYYQRALDNMGNGFAIFSKELVDQRLELLGNL